MAQDRRVARRYASALFEAGKQAQSLSAIESDLGAVVDALHSDENFKYFLLAPYSSREEKVGILTRALGGKIDPVALQLLRIVLEKRREAEIPALYEEFVELRRRYESVAFAEIVTAEPIDAAQQTAVVSRLEALLGKKVEPSFAVDPAILGGIRVKYENFVMDGSVRGSLARLKESLKRDVLKQA